MWTRTLKYIVRAGEGRYRYIQLIPKQTIQDPDDEKNKNSATDVILGVKISRRKTFKLQKILRLLKSLSLIDLKHFYVFQLVSVVIL